MVSSISGTIHIDSGPTNCVSLFHSTDLTTSRNLYISQLTKIQTYMQHIYQMVHNFPSEAPHASNLKLFPMTLNDTKVNDTIDTEQDSNSLCYDLTPLTL